MGRRELKRRCLTLTSQHFSVVFSNASLLGPVPLCLGGFLLPHQEAENLEQGSQVWRADDLLTQDHDTYTGTSSTAVFLSCGPALELLIRNT